MNGDANDAPKKPEENPFRPTICGEDYRLAEFPRDATGCALWQGASGADYENYLDWLADYLYAQRGVELEAKQARLREFASSQNKEVAAAGVGAHAADYDGGLCELDIRIFENQAQEPAASESSLDLILDQTVDRDESEP